MTHAPAISFFGGLGNLLGRGPVTSQSNKVRLLCPCLPSLRSPLTGLHLLKSLYFSRVRTVVSMVLYTAGNMLPATTKLKWRDGWTASRSSRGGWNEAMFLTVTCLMLLFCLVLLGGRLGSFWYLGNLFKGIWFLISIPLILKNKIRRLPCLRPSSGLELK